MTVRTILYDASGHDREVDLGALNLAQLGPDQLLWMDVSSAASQTEHLPPEISACAEPLDGLGSLQIFDDHYQFAVRLPDRDKSKLGFVVSKTWLITQSEHRPPFLDEFLSADRGETLKGRMTPTALMAALVMRQLEAFRDEVASVDNAIDKLDDTILRSREKRAPLKILAALRRRVAGLRAGLADQRAVIHSLIGPDFFAHVSQSDQPFLVETNRVFERLEDDISRARDTVIGSFELYASRVAQDTNQLIKALTIVTVVTGIVGAVAGIFGMNFDTSIPHTGMTGFLMVTGSMIIASIALIAVAIWRRWL